MLQSIVVDIQDYPEIVAQGKTFKERKQLLWCCYAVYPKIGEIDKLSLEEMIDYIKETDEFYSIDKPYIDKCVELIAEFQ